MDTAVRRANRFSLGTADFLPGESHQGLVDAVTQAMRRPFALEVLNPPAPLRYRMDGVLLGSTMVARLQSTPIEVGIGRSTAPEDNIVVEILVDGPGFDAEQSGQQLQVERGGALISMGALPRRNRVEAEVELLILQMPLQTFAPLLDPAVGRPMSLLPPDAPGLLTLQRYLQSIIDAPGDSDPDMPRLMAGQLQALCLQLMRRAWPGATEPRGPLAWARAARAHVAQHLASPGLDEHSVSRALGISGSYLRKLFVEEGGFAAYVRRARLDRALTMLRDPACSGLRVIDIAHACGFDDLSTFNRQFRRRHLGAPSALRAVTRLADGSR